MIIALRPTKHFLGLTCQIDPQDYPLVSRFKWSAIKVSPQNHYPYAVTWDVGRLMFMHRLIMNPLPGIEIDHKNGDGLDNRRKNLRICTVSENRQNTAGWKNRPSKHLQGFKFKGVYHPNRCTGNQGGKPWEARICYGGKQRVVGNYFTPQEAALAYDEQARIHHGKFARLNFPKPGEMGLA